MQRELSSTRRQSDCCPFNSLGNEQAGMDNLIKAALIVSGAILVAVCLWIYFSPYYSCVRAGKWSEIQCAAAVGRR
jgi:hypothetical protein